MIDQRIYVGFHSTNNLNDSYMGSSKSLQKDIKELGRNNFKKEILFIFDNKEDMVNKECEIVDIEFVNRIDTYNCVPGGEGYRTIGTHLTIEHRQRISESNKGKILSEETKALIREKSRLQVFSAETRAKFSKRPQNIVSRPCSNQTKEKISKANKGQKKPPRTEEHCRSISISVTGELNHMYGKTITDETRKKMSNSMKGKNTGPQSEEHKRKAADARRGKHTSERNEYLKQKRIERKIDIFVGLLGGIIQNKLN